MPFAKQMDVDEKHGTARKEIAAERVGTLTGNATDQSARNATSLKENRQDLRGDVRGRHRTIQIVTDDRRKIRISISLVGVGDSMESVETKRIAGIHMLIMTKAETNSEAEVVAKRQGMVFVGLKWKRVTLAQASRHYVQVKGRRQRTLQKE